MAIKTENFESLTIGANPPFDGFTADIPSAVTIVAGGTATGGVVSTKACHIRGGNLIYDSHPIFSSDVSAFFDLYLIQEKFLLGESLEVFQIRCNNLTIGISTLVSLRIETDCTLSIYTDLGATRICSSGDFSLALLTWNFVQFNIKLTPVLVLGVSKIQVELHFAVNGKEVASGTVISGIQISNLEGVDAHFNIWEFASNEIVIDNIVFDTHQAIITYPNAGTPFNKVFQGIGEIPILPDSGEVSIFQGLAEISILPDNTKLAIFQGVVELILLDTPSVGLWKVQEI